MGLENRWQMWGSIQQRISDLFASIALCKNSTFKCVKIKCSNVSFVVLRIVGNRSM